MPRSGCLKGAFASLLKSIASIARSIGLLAERSRAAIDATGLESRHVSRYFIWRLGARHKFSTYPKLTVVCEQLGIRSTIIAVRRNTNGTRQWPSTPYRREMKRSAARIGYGQRWQVESAFSRNKRLFGSALRARTWPLQPWECQLLVLTHNLMLVAAA
jgi:hypothetical protein